MIWQMINTATNTVTNIIEWDGQSDYNPPDGYELKQLGDTIGIGCVLQADGSWSVPESD